MQNNISSSDEVRKWWLLETFGEQETRLKWQYYLIYVQVDTNTTLPFIRKNLRETTLSLYEPDVAIAEVRKFAIKV